MIHQMWNFSQNRDCHHQQPTCRNQNHGGEEAHLFLAEAQIHELLAEVKHGVEEVSRTHGLQRLHSVLLPSQEGDRAVFDVKKRGEANHQHLRDKNVSASKGL